MFLGQQQSIEQHRYTTFSELYRYCYLVASTVGLICIYIWGYNGTEDTRKMAEYRGIALQLINVVRDVYTDAVEGNFFIPIELVKNNATMHQQIITGDHQEIIKAIENIIAKAEDYYQKSYGLERHVSRSGSLSMRVMSKTYFCLLKEIKKNPSLIFSGEKIKLTGWKKLMVCVISIVQWCVIG
jgi:phytoene synthase